MNFKEVKNHVEKALKLFLEKNKFLLRNNLNERTITHKLAEPVQKEFSDWDVDCEYNRNFDRIKRISYQQIRNDDTNATTVYPDIIIHHRNTEDNLLVIEIKKNASNSEKEDDRNKIELLMKEFNYSYGLFIDFKTGTEKIEFQKQWFPEKYNQSGEIKRRNKMPKCPDCDSVKILSIPDEGDGKCRVCHGSGKTVMDEFVEGFLGGESECSNCNGSGICPTCGGTGVVD